MAASPEATWLAVGRVRRPHGIHGEATVEILTDFPERMADGVEIGLGHDAPEFTKVVYHVRIHKRAAEIARGYSESLSTRTPAGCWQRGCIRSVPCTS